MSKAGKQKSNLHNIFCVLILKLLKEKNNNSVEKISTIHNVLLIVLYFSLTESVKYFLFIFLSFFFALSSNNYSSIVKPRPLYVLLLKSFSYFGGIYGLRGNNAESAFSRSISIRRCPLFCYFQPT